MKAAALAASAALSTCSAVTEEGQSAPYAMFSAIEQENKTGSYKLKQSIRATSSKAEFNRATVLWTVHSTRTQSGPLAQRTGSALAPVLLLLGLPRHSACSGLTLGGLA